MLGFSKQGYYRWLRNPASARDWEEVHQINAAFDVHGDDPVFGCRLISDELIGQGFIVSERRVWRLCSPQQLWRVFMKRKIKKPKLGPPIHDDLVQRVSTADALRMAIVHWIERTYHRHCRQCRLGKLTPIELETIMKDAVTLVA